VKNNLLFLGLVGVALSSVCREGKDGSLAVNGTDAAVISGGVESVVESDPTGDELLGGAIVIDNGS